MGSKKVNTSDLVTISEAALFLNKSVETLRLWDLKKVFKPFKKTKTGHRYYSLTQLAKKKAELKRNAFT